MSHIFDNQTFDGISNSLATKESSVLQQYKYPPTSEVISESLISLAVYSLTFENRKISQVYIKEQFGSVGDFELEKLLQRQVVFLEEDGSLRAKGPMLRLTKDQVIDSLPDLELIRREVAVDWV